MNQRTKTILVLVLIALWGLLSWWWYVCGIKGFCAGAQQQEASSEQTQESEDVQALAAQE